MVAVFVRARRRPSPGMNDFYVICEQAFTIIFNAEMAIKLAALHMEYFKYAALRSNAAARAAPNKRAAALHHTNHAP